MSNKRRIVATGIIFIALLRIWNVQFLTHFGYKNAASEINSILVIWLKHILVVAGIILFPIDKKDK